MVRSSADYSHICRDSFFAPTGAWAFRTTVSGAGSYRGDMPFYARIFSADELVRGFRPGELGPDAIAARTAPSGAPVYSAAPACANFLTAVNAEYPFHLVGRTDAPAFLPHSSRLLPP